MRASIIVAAPLTALAALLVHVRAAVILLGVIALILALAILADGARHAEGPIRATKLGPFLSAMGATFMALWATLGLLS